MADSRSITRRLFMRHGAASGVALSTLTATTGPGAAFAAAQSPTPETPIDRVHRLAEEISDAIAAWEAEIEATGYPRAIECVTHAARRDGIRPIMFKPIRPAPSPQERISLAASEYVAAAKAIDPTATEWTASRWADRDERTRFFLIGARKVQS